MESRMGTRWADGGYSSDVEIYLCINEERLRVAQVGPTRLVLLDRREIKPGTSVVILVRVDGVEDEYHAIVDNWHRLESDNVIFREVPAVPF